MKNVKCTVYKIICDIPEDHVVYIGKTTQTLGGRLSHHAAIQRRPTRLNKLIAKVGKEHFRIEEVESSFDHDRMAQLERDLIVSSGCLDTGCNRRVGARYLVEDRMKARLESTASKAVICIEDGKTYLSAIQAAECTGAKQSDVTMCCNMKIRQSNGRHFMYVDGDKEAYMRYWSTGIKRNRRVICVETGQVYKNTYEAGVSLGINPCSVNRACSAKHFVRKLGIHLEWLDECAPLVRPVIQDSDTALCGMS